MHIRTSRSFVDHAPDIAKLWLAESYGEPVLYGCTAAGTPLQLLRFSSRGAAWTYLQQRRRRKNGRLRALPLTIAPYLLCPECREALREPEHGFCSECVTVFRAVQ